MRVSLAAAALALSPLALAQAPAPAAPAPARTEEAGKEAATRESEAVKVKELPTLEQRIRPVSGRVFGKAGRFELGLGAELSFADAFYSKYFGSITATYHFSEMFAAGLRLSGGLSVISGAAVTCGGDGCQAPTDDQLKTAPGKMPFLAALTVQVAPVYGKINLLAEKVLHFDVYLGLGGGVVSTSVGGASAMAPGGTISVGTRLIFNKFVALRLEVGDYLYLAGTPDARLQQQFMADLGVSFFLPTEFEGG